MSTIELSSGERMTICAALEVYRRVKSAEKMLTCQRIKDETERANGFANYDRLLALIKSANEKVTP